MYATGEIDTWGFIYAHLSGGREMMHRETRAVVCPFATLDAAKEELQDPSPMGNPGIILDYNKEGGVDSIWCYEGVDEEIRKRLRIWSGCYGAWKVRRLNAKAAA